MRFEENRCAANDYWSLGNKIDIGLTLCYGGCERQYGIMAVRYAAQYACQLRGEGAQQMSTGVPRQKGQERRSAQDVPLSALLLIGHGISIKSLF